MGIEYSPRPADITRDGQHGPYPSRKTVVCTKRAKNVRTQVNPVVKRKDQAP